MATDQRSTVDRFTLANVACRTGRAQAPDRLASVPDALGAGDGARDFVKGSGAKQRQSLGAMALAVTGGHRMDRSIFRAGNPDAGDRPPPLDALREPESGALFGVPGLPARGGLENVTLDDDGRWTARCPSCGLTHARSSFTKAAAWSWLVAHLGTKHGR